VASLEEAERHQHLAGGHGGGCEQMSPLPLRGSGVRDLRIFYIYIFNTKSCVLMHSLASKIGTISVFIKTPMHWGKWRLLEEAAEWGPKGRKSRPKAESRVEFLGRGSKPHQLGGVWCQCKQDQILKQRFLTIFSSQAKTKTKVTRPRPRPSDVL